MTSMVEYLNIPNLSWKEKLAYLGYQFRKGPQRQCPVEESWDEDTYIRKMPLPKDTLFIGRPHKHGHRCSLLEGEVILFEDGSQTTLKAPQSLHTIPGYQMVLYAVTDVLGATYHPRQYTEDDIFGSTEELERLGEEVSQRLLRKVA